jgi:hypothetical protein
MNPNSSTHPASPSLPESPFAHRQSPVRTVNAWLEKRGARDALLVLLVFVLLLARRWQQYARPQVWDEEGTIIIREFVDRGLSAFLLPVHDYHVLVSKIISWISLQVSFLYYPVVSTLLTAVATAAIVLAVAKSPTLLRGKYLCAVLVLLVPTNPEVFAVPLYLFWWSSILLFLLCVWDPERPRTLWRMFLAALAGLSTPAIFLTVPVLWVRLLVFRGRRGSELLVALAGTVAAGVQLIPFFTKHITSGKFPFVEFAQHVIPKYFGFFAVGHWFPQTAALWLGGLLVLATIIAWAIVDGRRFATAVLLYLLFGAIVLASFRISPAAAHPENVAPRYFFFPYIIAYWILVQCLLLEIKTAWRTVAGAVIAVSLLNALPVFSRSHVDLKWKNHVRSCPQFEQYQLPIQYDGTAKDIWYLPMPKATCERLLREDFFYTASNLESRALSPFVLIKDSKREQPFGQLVSDGMRGTDAARSAPPLPDLVVIGSFVRSDDDRGSATFKLRRGERILYRSGSSTSLQRLSVIGTKQVFMDTLPLAADWVTLDFSNRLLPDEFLVKATDAGTAKGEWSAYAVRPAQN